MYYDLTVMKNFLTPLVYGISMIYSKKAFEINDF